MKSLLIFTNITSQWKDERYRIFLAQGFSSLATLLGNIGTAKYLGEENLGLIAAYWWLLLLPVGIGQAMWIQQGPRIAALLQQQGISLWKNHLLTALLSMIVIVLCTSTIASQCGIIRLPHVIGITFLLGWASYDLMRRWLVVAGHPNRALAADLLYGIGISFSLLCGYLSKGVSVQAALLCWIASTVLPWVVIPLSWFQIPTFQNLKLVLRLICIEGRWLIGTSFLQWYAGNAFLTEGVKQLNVNEIGALRASQTLMGGWNIGFQYMETNEPRKYAKALFNSNNVGLLQLLKKSILSLLPLVICLLGGQALLSNTLITKIFGLEFSEHSWILSSFCLLYLLIYITYPLRFANRALGRNKLTFISYGTTAILGYLCAPLIVTQWGIAGVMAGLFISQFIQLITQGFSLFKSIKINQ
jgi:hypothetical protein